MAQYDCDKFDCEKLRHYSLGGIPDSELLSRNIQPGSQQALDLQSTIDDIFAHCCAVNLGEDPGTGPVTVKPPVGLGVIPASTIAIGNAPSPPLTVPAVPVWLRWAAIVVVVYAVTSVIAGLKGYVQCFLVRRRVKNNGDIECLYVCNDARTYYRTSKNPIFGCPPFIYMPV